MSSTLGAGRPRLERARKRRPARPPAPISRGLSSGPTGLDNVLTATAAAARKPSAAPSAVAVAWSASIHRRRAARNAAHGLAMRPPAMPPMKRAWWPKNAPTIEPRKPPAPPAATRSRKIRTQTTFYHKANDGSEARPFDGSKTSRLLQRPPMCGFVTSWTRRGRRFHGKSSSLIRVARTSSTPAT